MKVYLTQNAQDQLRELYNFYKTLGKGMYARKIRTTILNRTKLLSANPKMGQREENLDYLKIEYRYLFVKPVYKIIYKIEDQSIFITDIFDTRGNPKNMKG